MNYGNNQDQAVRGANGRQRAWSSRKGSLEHWWEGRRRVSDKTKQYNGW